MSEYEFGVSGEMIWTTHILIGFYFIFLGYYKLEKIHSYILVVLGVIMIGYHSHLWYYHENYHNHN